MTGSANQAGAGSGTLPCALAALPRRYGAAMAR